MGTSLETEVWHLPAVVLADSENLKHLGFKFWILDAWAIGMAVHISEVPVVFWALSQAFSDNPPTHRAVAIGPNDRQGTEDPKGHSGKEGAWPAPSTPNGIGRAGPLRVCGPFHLSLPFNLFIFCCYEIGSHRVVQATLEFTV